MRPARADLLTVLLTVLLTGTALLVSACGTSNGAGDGAVGGTPSSAAPSPPSTSQPSGSTSPDRRPGGSASSQPQEEERQLEIIVGGERVTATLDDGAAGRDLVAQLPVTVEMTDHGGVEKTGRLPSALSLDGQPEGADPDVGDLGYYAPGQDLVLYYGDQSYFPGIVVLGRLDGDAAGRIAAVEGDVTVTATPLGG